MPFSFQVEDGGSTELPEVLPAIRSAVALAKEEALREGGRTIELHEKSVSAESKAGMDPLLLGGDPGNRPDPAGHPSENRYRV